MSLRSENSHEVIEDENLLKWFLMKNQFLEQYLVTMKQKLVNRENQVEIQRLKQEVADLREKASLRESELESALSLSRSEAFSLKSLFDSISVPSFAILDRAQICAGLRPRLCSWSHL